MPTPRTYSEFQELLDATREALRPEYKNDVDVQAFLKSLGNSSKGLNATLRAVAADQLKDKGLASTGANTANLDNDTARRANLDKKAKSTQAKETKLEHKLLKAFEGGAPAEFINNLIKEDAQATKGLNKVLNQLKNKMSGPKPGASNKKKLDDDYRPATPRLIR